MANQDVTPANSDSNAPTVTPAEDRDYVPEGDVTNYGTSSIDPYTNNYDQDTVNGEGTDEPLGIANRQHISRTETDNRDTLSESYDIDTSAGDTDAIDAPPMNQGGIPGATQGGVNSGMGGTSSSPGGTNQIPTGGGNGDTFSAGRSGMPTGAANLPAGGGISTNESGLQATDMPDPLDSIRSTPRD